MTLWQVATTFSLIASIAGLFVLLVRSITGGSMLSGFALGFAGMFGLLALLVLYKIARGRIQYALLCNEERDLALARRSALLDGGVIRRDALTLWTSGPKDWSPLVLVQLEESRNRFTALIGEPLQADLPLRVLLFGDRNWFLQYARGARLILPSGLDGFYLQGNSAKIVVAIPNRYARLVQPDRLLRMLFGYYFLNCYKGFLAHSWLYLGIGGLISRDPTSGEQARLTRRIRAELLRTKESLRARDLFKRNPKIIFRSGVKPGLHAEFAARTSLVFHAQALVDYLAGRDAPRERLEPFRAFLKDLKRKDNYDAVFRRHFGHGLEQLYNNWREWVLAKGVGEHEPPAAVFREALIDHIIPLVADRSAKKVERIQSIRDMGTAGYTLGADALMDLFDDRDQEVRATAVWALEAISGTIGGENIDHWEDWWDGLPRDAEPAGAEENAPDCRLIQEQS
jgi:hypothetical protein